MKIDWNNNNQAHRDWGLFAFGIVLMDSETGHVQFHPLPPEEGPETYNLTQEEFDAYKKEWYVLNVLINEIASKNFPANEEGLEMAKAEWRRYISQGTISQNTLSAAAKIMHVSFLE
jgi:Fe-S cluster biosynthesis and repair protein YggX